MPTVVSRYAVGGKTCSLPERPSECVFHVYHSASRLCWPLYRSSSARIHKGSTSACYAGCSSRCSVPRLGHSETTRPSFAVPLALLESVAPAARRLWGCGRLVGRTGPDGAGHLAPTRRRHALSDC